MILANDILSLNQLIVEVSNLNPHVIHFRLNRLYHSRIYCLHNRFLPLTLLYAIRYFNKLSVLPFTFVLTPFIDHGLRPVLVGKFRAVIICSIILLLLPLLLGHRLTLILPDVTLC